jgi:hypothetical protein
MNASIMRVAMLFLALLALSAAEGYAQAPVPDTGTSRPPQPQHELPPGGLDVLDKQKPEIEIYTSPEDLNPSSQSGLKGITVAPEEADTVPSAPEKEPVPAPKKNGR